VIFLVTYGKKDNTLSVCFKTTHRFFSLKLPLDQCAVLYKFYLYLLSYHDSLIHFELFRTTFFRMVSLLLRRVPLLWYEKLLLNRMGEPPNLKASVT